MTYVMSDIHGEYQKYLKMLRKISFSDSDTLYILGDMVDRGPQSAELLEDVFSRKNVVALMGNHELMAVSMLEILLSEITEENCSELNTDIIMGLLDWRMNGGDTTCESFKRFDPQSRLLLLQKMRELPLYKTVEIGGKTYILVHAGLGNFNEDKKLNEYSVEELMFSRTDLDKRFYSDENTFVVFGHTPTFLVTGEARIFRKNNNICVDCGATFEEGKLACIALETMEEFYV